jgi:SAM-dependent methyltransferase
MAPDVWDDGSAYEPYVGRWSRLVARQFLEWLEIPPGSAWLDFGCGTGALSQVILSTAKPRLVIGCDRSAGYTAFARQHIADERASFVVAELPDLPRVPGDFDAVVAGLVLNFLPDPRGGLSAMAARARKGGTVAVYVWDYADQMQMMRFFWDAAVALDPAARDLDEGVRFPICQPEQLRRLSELTGLRQVQVQPIDIPTVFRNFDDYWVPFLGGQAPAPGYAKGLPPERLAKLRDAIRDRLPIASDDSIRLIARAWAAKGIAA